MTMTTIPSGGADADHLPYPGVSHAVRACRAERWHTRALSDGLERSPAPIIRGLVAVVPPRTGAETSRSWRSPAATAVTG